jgi:DNA invertase Pin-like site-specific DNA recombinase
VGHFELARPGRHARRHQPKLPTETDSHRNSTGYVFGMAQTASDRAGTPNLVGYARVSTRDQEPGSQESALRAAGCSRVFVDHGESSRIRDRPEWLACLDYLRPGDTLIVRALDRLAGTTTMAIETINDLHERGINIKSLTEPDIDTTTAMGRALFGIVAVFAQLRVDTIRENTRRGLEHARAQGRVGGRPTVMSPERVAAAARMRDAGDSLEHIGKVLGVGASSVSRALARHVDPVDPVDELP